VLSTRDGGRTWSRRGELPRPENATGIVLEGRHGVWVTGYTVAGRPRVFRSVDSGRAWTRVAVPIGSFAAISIPRPGLVYLMNIGGRLFRSREDGVHWSKVSEAHRDLRDFVFVSANDGAAARLPRRHPTNAWRPSLGGDSPEHGAGFEGFTFNSERDGFAGDPANGFYRTHDGGRTWAYVYPPPIR
jgi:hypothetical protein